MKKQTKISVFVAVCVVLSLGCLAVILITNVIKRTRIREINEPLVLTEQSDFPAALQSGYGFSSAFSAGLAEGLLYGTVPRDDQSGVRTLMYADNAAGEGIPFCAKPQCLHDGSLYCTATTQAYAPAMPVCYDGKMYALARKFDQNANPDTAKNSLVLLRYDADGSSIDEVFDFKQAEWWYALEPASTIVHRGFVWCIVPRLTMNPDGDPVGGFEITGWELKTGHMYRLWRSMPEDGKQVMYCAPERLWGDGDYLYFNARNQSAATARLSPECKSGGLYRISLLDGTVERVSQALADCVCNGVAVWHDYAPDSAAKKVPYVLRLNEAEPLAWAEDVPDAKFATDGEYLYNAAQNKDGSTVQVYSLSGELLAEDPLPDGVVGFGMAMNNERFYIETIGRAGDDGGNPYDTNYLLSAPRADVLAGNAEFRMLANKSNAN